MFISGAVSDSITHFIGLFQIIELHERLRPDYDELTARFPEFETGPILSQDHHIHHPHTLPDLSVQLRHMAPAPDTAAAATGGAFGTAPVAMPALPGLPLHLSLPPLPHPASAATQGPAPEGPLLPPPGSVVVVISQQNALSDIDHIGIARMDLAAPPEALQAQLDALLARAEATGLPVPDLPGGEGDFTTMAQQMAQVLAAPPDTGFVASGMDAHGLHRDGTSTDQRPAPQELLPQDRQDRITREEDGSDSPAHDIIHGGNMLVNEVSLAASWISAPVLAVGGDSISIDMISQVNLWQDSDILLTDGGYQVAPHATTATNIAGLSHASHAPLQDVGDAPAFWAPAFWLVTSIEGSLINFNHIQQQNFVSDGDVTSITLTASRTVMTLGANQAVNSVSLLELGQEFELIIVDGSLINLAAIHQTNVLLDSDHVTLRDGWGGQVGTGENLLVNDASIHQVGLQDHQPAEGGYRELLDDPGNLPRQVLDDPGFAGLEGLRVLHVKGDLVSAQIISQVNVLGDADQVDLLAAHAMENAGDVSIVTGANLLINSAHIAEYGVDSTIHLAGNSYSDALIHQAGLVDTASPYAGAGLAGSGLPGSGLASEAVAFLAENMASVAPPAPDIAAPAHDFETISIDPMQTVLA